MRAVVQRVSEASVRVAGQTVGRIGAGLLVLLGVGTADAEADAAWMAEKLLGLRIFEDEDGKMNRSVADAEGGLLVVSQFTLFGDCRKGKRPGFSDAARPELAIPLYEKVVTLLRDSGLVVETGVFQTDMKVALVNDGPVTLLVDSKKTF
jgi:D-tyrosyl-tRNA(Tyr) deacylase